MGFILYYLLSFLLSHITFSQTEHPLRFLFKIILVSVCLNSTHFICEFIFSINSYISLSIREVGETLFGKSICFSSLIQELNKYTYLNNGDFNIFSFDGVMKSFVSFGLLNLTFSYSLRYIMIKVFILICPFAILSLIMEKTYWFFKTWIRTLFSLLFIQNLISIILVITFSIQVSYNNLFLSLLYMGSIYALLQANAFTKEFVGGISTHVQSGFHYLSSIFR